MLTTVPARAAGSSPHLTVTINSLSPSRLRDGSTVTMTGTVTNRDQHVWRKVQAYLVIPGAPFTTRAQIGEAINNGAAYTGSRVIDQGLFDDMGDLAAGQTLNFRVKVPYGKLGISGAQGVYPVGIQILGTDTNGQRSRDAIARATTFLPLISSGQRAVPASVLWPFLMPDYRTADGNYHDPRATLADISSGGQLRNLLDLATSVPRRSSTALIDPALLVGVDDLVHKRHLPKSVEISDSQVAAARTFLNDLLNFARSGSCWVLGFDRPDVLALANNSDLRRPLTAAIEDATEAALTKFQLSGRRVSWPTKDGVTANLLSTVRGDGDNPVILTSSDVPGWQRRLGSIVRYTTPGGPVPLVVNDSLDVGVPGEASVVTLRQRILSEAALAVLQRAIDPKSRADAVTMVDPLWDPGSSSSNGDLGSAFDAAFVSGSSLEDLMTTSLSTYQGKVPVNARARTLTRAQLEAASDLLIAGTTLTSIMPTTGSTDTDYARDAAEVLGVRWRTHSKTGVTIAQSRARAASADLGKIKIQAPPSVTLSSSSGGFPLTITNGTEQGIHIGVAIDSSNPGLTIPRIKPVDIGAGERHTVTVKVDLHDQNATFLTASLVSSNGETISHSKPFKVRSSKVGAVLWVAMGLTGALVLVALFRRFRRRRSRIVSERLADDD
ncbi:MAG: hypothetical protein JWQ70_2621 [Aeromicrobium sp.]|nr:hypothetical protein [Aeromicrobium sp.]